MYILSAIFLLCAVIFIHELGHFLFAKLLGVRVLKFSLGFGPKLVGRKNRGTEYLVSLIPLGGYVKMLGENQNEEIKEKEKPFAYNCQPIWKRFLILAAGPLFNMLLAAIIFTIISLLTRDANIITNMLIGIGVTREVLIMTIKSFVDLITGIIPASSLGGPIAIVQIASQQASNGMVSYLILMAFVSLNVGIVNLLPIPILDGGHIFFLGIEAIRKKPVSRKFISASQKVGLAIILIIISLAVYNDIARLITKR